MSFPEYQILAGDAVEQLRTLPDESIHCCVTSPPYFNLRDYEVDGQIGLESTPDEFIENLASVFAEVFRVLRNDGTLWLNIGDTQKNKQLLGIPYRLALRLQQDGWIWRDTIVWHKPNPMPEAVKDRCTKAWEPIFMLAKNTQYYYGFDEMQEEATYAGQGRGGSRNRYEQNSGNLNGKKYDTRNMRNVWSIIPANTPGKKHYASYPEELARRCIVAGCPDGGTVLDPFLGSGTTALVALQHGRKAIGIELNPEYVAIADERINTAIQQKRLFF